MASLRPSGTGSLGPSTYRISRVRPLAAYLSYRSEQYKFEDWRLAFEVDLKFEEYEVIRTTSTSFTSTFQDSFAYKEYSSTTDRILKHIYMDLESKFFCIYSLVY